MTQPPASCDVAIVGGGVIGCACAYALAREGLRVRLFERGDIAGEASGAAAGMLAPISEAEEGSVLRREGLASLTRIPELAAELRDLSGVDPEWVASGLVRVTRDEGEAEVLRRKTREGVAHGLEWLDAGQLSQVVPGVRGDVCGFLSPHEAHVRSASFAQAYAGAAVALGARVERGVAVETFLREGERVVGVGTSSGSVPAETVLLCAGPFSSALAVAPVVPGVLPVTPVRGQIVSLDTPAPPFAPILWGDAAYLVPKRDGRLVVGATSEHVGFDRRVTGGGVSALLTGALDLLPTLASSTFRGAWAGLRPVTPDGLPLIGPVPAAPGLVLATGHGRNGVLLSARTGELVRDGILGKGWGDPAFAPDRFA